MAVAQVELDESGIWAAMAPSEKAIWPILARWMPARGKGDTFFRSGRDIARASGISLTRVWPAINRLIDRGLLERVVRGSGAGKANVYRMLRPVAADSSHDATGRKLRLVTPCDGDRSHYATENGRNTELPHPENTRKTQSKKGAVAPAARSSGNAKGLKFDPTSIDLPAELDTPEFRAAWGDWCAHRREKRQALTPTPARKQISKLAEMGLTRAIAALEHSATSSYTGIFEPNGNTHGNRPSPTNETDRGEFAYQGDAPREL